MAHLTKLYEEGLNRIAQGVWHIPGVLFVTSIEGKQYNIKYKYRSSFELGTMYVGDSVVVYSIPTEYFSSLHLTDVSSVVKSFKFNSADMKAEFSKYLPNIKTIIKTTTDTLICISKTKDVLPLSVVLKYFDNFVQPEHVAWIMSSLHNMLCYLQYTGIVHNAIDLDNYFISPELHSGLLLGGWWYSVPYESKIVSIPSRTFKYMSPADISAKRAGYSIDCELARATCRSLLGDEIGSKLALDKRLVGKNEFVNWLRLSGKRDRIKDYRTWKKEILIRAFGKIKFVPMHIDINAAYEKAGGVI
jgi:hypothetical protein